MTNQIRAGQSEIKPNLKIFFPHPSLFSGLNFTPVFSASSPEVAQWDGEWGLQSIHHLFSLLLLPPHTPPLLQCVAPPTTDLHHKLLQCESFPQAAVLHELLQHGSLPWRAVFQEQTAPAWVPHGITSPASKPAAVWAPWVHRSFQKPAVVWAHHGVTPSFRHPPALVWGILQAAGGYLLHHGPPWAAGGQPASP